MKKFVFLIIVMMIAISQDAMSQSQYRVKMTFGENTLMATLDDNSTTRAFVAQLPLTLPMLDLYGVEMCYRFQEALPTDDVSDQAYEVGEIMYWPPRHSFVIRYAQNNEVFEMQKMGKVDSGVEILDGIGDIDITFELVCLGDVNDDSETNIADVTATIGYILDNNEVINRTNADANLDGEIDIADVTAIINLILNNQA